MEKLSIVQLSPTSNLIARGHNKAQMCYFTALCFQCYQNVKLQADAEAASTM